MFISTLIILTTISVVFFLILGLLKLYLESRSDGYTSELVPTPFIQVLVPIKGASLHQETILKSLLNQTYPFYKVSFIIENENDESRPILKKLCEDFPQHEILMSGRTTQCGQKNFGLAYAVDWLEPNTEIIVTCDSNSIAKSDWLMSMSRPIREGKAQTVTTFRTFNPLPTTVAGACQAIYGSLVSMLIAITPKPWGGSTAIRRELFDRLDIQSYWYRTVVDDLVMGNVLAQSGIRIHFSLDSVMETPLYYQSVKGFLAFLHRQILFPKFTNPGIWLSSMIWQFMMSVSSIASIILVAVDVFNLSFGLDSLAACFFLMTLLVAFIVLNKINPHQVSLAKWLIAMFPMLFLSTYVYLHSLFVNYIDWSGKRYYCTNSGVVTKFEELSD